MNITQILNGLKNKSIKLIENHHNTNDVIERLDSYVQHKQDWLQELKNCLSKNVDYVGQHNNTIELKKLPDMIEYLETSQNINTPYLFDPEYFCFNCGSYLHLIIIDEVTVALEDLQYFWEKEKEGFTKKHLQECPAKQLVKDKKIITEISVPSGELLFVNCFETPEIYDFKEPSQHSINALMGRAELAKYLATKNIGYGQMGNMSISVFINKNRDEIIIGDIEKEFDGFEERGRISLSVWRWMCGDIQVLKSHGEELPAELKPSMKISYGYEDYILLNVKKGIWRIEHYFDFHNSDIYSKLFLNEKTKNVR